ncbi:Serine proteases trypsin domain [Trinorchestia longiramus]|nr:Serine proteases trypsin domain [Trinorchestia longiramus]
MTPDQQAALFNGPKQFCGGSLIDSTHILTAAHCVATLTSVDLSRLRIVLGAHNIQRTEATTQTFTAKKVVRHKDYDPVRLMNDIAMITLNKPATLTQHVQPICLNSDPTSLVQEVGTVAGWGSLFEGGPQQGSLWEVQLVIWDNNSCRAKYGPAAPGGIVPSYLCAGRGGKDSCSGDSGGPIIKRVNGVWTQVGLVSWGIGCGKGQYPGVYSRMTYFLPWITEVINKF